MENKKILGADGKEIKKPERENKVVEMPEEIKTKIEEKRVARQQLLKEFLSISVQRAGMVKREQEILDLLKSNSDSVNARVKVAYKKLKLDKDVEYTYQYSDKGTFIGYPKKKKA